MTELWRIIAVCVAAVFGGIGPVYFKKASARFSLSLSLLTNWDLYAGVSAYGFATLLFIPALSGGDLSVLYPLVGTSNIWLCIFSMKMLGEKMNMRKWIGIALIVIGMTLIGMGNQ